MACLFQGTGFSLMPTVGIFTAVSTEAVCTHQRASCKDPKALSTSGWSLCLGVCFTHHTPAWDKASHLTQVTRPRAPFDSFSFFLRIYFICLKGRVTQGDRDLPSLVQSLSCHPHGWGRTMPQPQPRVSCDGWVSGPSRLCPLRYHPPPFQSRMDAPRRQRGPFSRSKPPGIS